MAQMISWYGSVAEVRQAVLDLLTGGIPQEDIGVIVGAGGAGADDDTADAARPYAFAEGLVNSTTLTLPEVGPVVAAGPLADALAPGGAGITDTLAGIAQDQATAAIEQLRNGGALLAVRSNGARDTIVYGVLRHMADPALRAQAERAGPIDEDELAASDPNAPPSASVGALTAGAMGGGWAAAQPALTDLPEDTGEDETRRHERNL